MIRRLTWPEYPYNFDAANKAHQEWGANCGPNALATMLGLDINEVRKAIPQFEVRKYTSPTMMQTALANLGVKWHSVPRPKDNNHAFTKYGLVRVQFCGPWTQAGSNPKWAYRHTHWIGAAEFSIIGYSKGTPVAASADGSPVTYVFDCNSGWLWSADWEDQTCKALMKEIPRCNGEWYSTHLWELDI